MEVLERLASKSDIEGGGVACRRGPVIDTQKLTVKFRERVSIVSDRWITVVTGLGVFPGVTAKKVFDTVRYIVL